MKHLLCAALVLLCASGAAASGDVASEIMSQPGAPIKVDGCSATPQPMRDGNNVLERASFESVGPRTATAVRIGFAFFDALGGRQVRNGVATGTFTPNARIDLTPFAGKIGAETRKLVCFAYQATFSDGTTWMAPALPENGSLPAPAAAAAPTQAESTAPGLIPSEMLQPDNGPVRFDRCSFTMPRDTLLSKVIVLTNTSEKRIQSADVAFVLYTSAGKASLTHSVFRGDFAPGAPIAGQATTTVPGRFTKAYCAVGIVEYTDGTKWDPGAGFLKRATAP